MIKICRGAGGLATDTVVLPAAANEAASAGLLTMARKKRRKAPPLPVRKKPRRDSAFREPAKVARPVTAGGRGQGLDFWRDSVSGLTDWGRLALLVGGLMSVFYLAFASGGYFFVKSAPVVLFLLYLLVLGLLFNLQVPGALGRAGWVLIGSFAAFALWNLLSMTWSFVPAASLDEFIRAIMYMTALGLFYMFLARQRWLEWMGNLYVAIAVAVGGWALMGKALPAVIIHDDSLFQHNRLTFPLTYWNALAIFMIMAVPLALRIASDREGRLAWRGLSLGAMVILLTVVFFTFSRAGDLLLLPVVSVQLLCASHRLRLLALAGLAFLWTFVLIMATSLLLPAMMASSPEMADKIDQGGSFGILVLVICLLAVASILPVRLLERSVSLTPAAGRRIGYGLAAVAVALAMVAAGAVVVRAGGPADLAGAVADTLSGREASSSVETGQERLLSLQSERYQEYSVSLSTVAENPLVGTGAGTWFVNWNRERPLFYNAAGEPYEVNVRDGHSWLLETLAELGLAGGALLVTFIAVFVYIAVRDLRALGRSREREVYGALFTACVALLLHAMVDWDWEMPAVMLPFFMFAGGLLRFGALSRSADKSPASPAEGGEEAGRRRFMNWRMLLGVGCLLAMAVAGSLWISERHTQSARILSDQCKNQPCAQGTYVVIRQEAQSARRFNPFDAEPLFVEAAAWQMEAVDGLEKGMSDDTLLYALSEAERLLEQALEIEPDNDDYYRKLALIYLYQEKVDDAAIAIRKARELNPYESRETGWIEERVREAGDNL